jgi:DNA end-binding protein Ku
MDKVAIGTVVLTSREHIIALEPLEKGLKASISPNIISRR